MLSTAASCFASTIAVLQKNVLLKTIAMLSTAGLRIEWTIAVLQKNVLLKTIAVLSTAGFCIAWTIAVLLTTESGTVQTIAELKSIYSVRRELLF